MRAERRLYRGRRKHHKLHMCMPKDLGLRCTFSCDALYEHLLGAFCSTIQGPRRGRHETGQRADHAHVGGLGVGLETRKKCRQNESCASDVYIVDRLDRLQQRLQTVLGRRHRGGVRSRIRAGYAEQGLGPQGTKHNIKCIKSAKFLGEKPSDLP